MPSHLNGLIAATLTPFTATGEVDVPRIEPLVEHLLQQNIKGFYVCGSTGEGVSLSTSERKLVSEEVIRHTNHRIPVIVQVGHNSLAEAKELARHAAEQQADIISATCPSYFKINDIETLLEYVGEIAAAAPETPFYYYHIPALTGSTINIVDFLRRGREQIPNLHGLKYTDTKLFEFQECQAVANGDLDIVWGCDEMLLGAIATGAKAAIGSTYNAAAPLSYRIIEACERGDIQAARELQMLSVKFIRVLLSYPFHAALKQTMQQFGVELGPCRTPLKQLSPTQSDQLNRELKDLGFPEAF